METVIYFVFQAVRIYTFLLIISILLSWLPNAKESNFGQMLSRITDPYLDIFRRFIPPIGMIDISPIVAIFTLQLATNGLLVLFRPFL